MNGLTASELQVAAKNRAWEVVRRWRRLSVDDETFAAMVTKAVMGDADSAADAADREGLMADRDLLSRQWFRDHAGVMLNDTDEEGMEEWAIVAAYTSKELKTEAEWREAIDYEAAAEALEVWADQLADKAGRWSATVAAVDAAVEEI